MSPQIAIQRMHFNISAARELVRCGLLTTYMRGHYSGVLATYSREANTPAVAELNLQLQAELEQLVDGHQPTRPFDVEVTTEAGHVSYSAISKSSADVAMAAIDSFGACGVTVRPR